MAKKQNDPKTVIVNKINTRNCGFDKRAILARLDAANGEPVELYHVFGIVRKAIGDEGPNGQFVWFVGEFMAEGVDNDGVAFAQRSAKCLVPAMFEATLESRCLAVTDDKGKMKPLKFGIKVGAVVAEQSATGYQYTVEPTVKMQDSDELTSLRTEIMEN